MMQVIRAAGPVPGPAGPSRASRRVIQSQTRNESAVPVSAAAATLAESADHDPGLAVCRQRCQSDIRVESDSNPGPDRDPASQVTVAGLAHRATVRVRAVPTCTFKLQCQ